MSVKDNSTSRTAKSELPEIPSDVPPLAEPLCMNTAVSQTEILSSYFEQQNTKLETNAVTIDELRTTLLQSRTLLGKFAKERDFHRDQHKRATDEYNKSMEDMQKLVHLYEQSIPMKARLKDRNNQLVRENAMLQVRLYKQDQQSNCPREASKKIANEVSRSRGFSLSRGDSNTRCLLEFPPKICKGSSPRPMVSVPTLQNSGTIALDHSICRIKAHPYQSSKWVIGTDQGIVHLITDEEGALDPVISSDNHGSFVTGLAIYNTCNTTSSDSGPIYSIASGDGNGTIRLLSGDHSLNSIHKLENQHNGCIWSLDHADSSLLSSSSDKTVKLFDLDSMKCKQVYRGHAGSVNMSLFHPNGLFVSCSSDKSVCLWDLRSSNAVQSWQLHGSSLNCLDIWSDNFVVSGDSSGHLTAIDLRSNKVYYRNNVGSCINSIDISSTGAVAVGRDDSTILLMHAELLDETQNLESGARPVSQTAWSSGGVLAATAGRGTIKFWKTTV